MNKTKKCRCIKPYKIWIQVLGYIEDIPVFNDGEELYYKYDEDVDGYFVSKDLEKLKHMFKYPEDVEDISTEMFNIHFQKIN